MAIDTKTEEALKETHTLDDVIVALQKSFSRVSYRTARLSEESARSLIVGKITFDIMLKVNIRGDRLYVSPEGSINLKLAGIIDHDVREVVRTESANPEEFAEPRS